MFHLHCVDDWLDLCVQNLFSDSLGPVDETFCSWSLCVLNLLRDFRDFCGLLCHLRFAYVDDLLNDSVPRFVPLECWERLHDLLDWITSTIFS